MRFRCKDKDLIAGLPTKVPIPNLIKVFLRFLALKNAEEFTFYSALVKVKKHMVLILSLLNDIKDIKKALLY